MSEWQESHRVDVRSTSSPSDRCVVAQVLVPRRPVPCVRERRDGRRLRCGAAVRSRTREAARLHHRGEPRPPPRTLYVKRRARRGQDGEEEGVVEEEKTEEEAEERGERDVRFAVQLERASWSRSRPSSCEFWASSSHASSSPLRRPSSPSRPRRPTQSTFGASSTPERAAAHERLTRGSRFTWSFSVCVRLASFFMSDPTEPTRVEWSRKRSRSGRRCG